MRTLYLILAYMLSLPIALYGKMIIGNETIINVDINDIREIKLSDIAESVRLIPLITNKTVMIPEVNKVYVDNDIIIVKGQVCQNHYLFDRKGHFLADLCDVLGHDKLEINLPGGLCTLMHTVSVDHKKREIRMYSGEDIYIYSYLGEILRQEQAPGLAIEQVLSLRKGDAFITAAWSELYATPMNALLVINNKKGTEQYLTRPDFFYSHNFIDVSELRKEYLLHFFGSDTLYSLNKNKATLKSSYVVNFGDYAYPDKLGTKDYHALRNYADSNKDKAGFVSDVKATDDIILFRYQYNGEYNEFLYNVKNGESLNGRVKYDIFTGGDISLVGSTAQSFIFVISDPWHLRLVNRGGGFLSDEEIKYIESINEDTDYILLEVFLKI
ncbi:MAG TPA: 6-bladed beta-propeller [Bacteroidaceae bacterium]|nr:6-bladed beta-propeller [Bacteroidaceae bacterium]